MYRIIFALVISFSLIGPAQSRISMEDKLKSENQLLSKKVALIERRNRILDGENSIYKKTVLENEKKIRQLNAKIDELEAVMKSNSEEYDRSMRDWKSRHDALTEKSAANEKRLATQIEQLIEKNKNTETVLGGEIKKIREEMKAAQVSHDKETDRIKKELIARESELNKKIDEGKKSLAERDDIIVNLDKLNRDYDIRLKNMMKEDEAQVKQLQAFEDESKKNKEEMLKKDASITSLEVKLKASMDDQAKCSVRNKEHETSISKISEENAKLSSQVKLLEAKIDELLKAQKK